MAQMNMAVIGAGSWGTTVASLAAANTPTTLWARRPEIVESINTHHINPDYIGGIGLSPNLRASMSLEDTVSSADIVVMAVPSQGFRHVLSEASQFSRPWVPGVSWSKGLETGSSAPKYQGAKESLPGHPG